MTPLVEPTSLVLMSPTGEKSKISVTELSRTSLFQEKEEVQLELSS